MMPTILGLTTTEGSSNARCNKNSKTSVPHATAGVDDGRGHSMTVLLVHTTLATRVCRKTKGTQCEDHPPKPESQPGTCRCRRRARPQEEPPRGSFFFFLFFLFLLTSSIDFALFSNASASCHASKRSFSSSFLSSARRRYLTAAPAASPCGVGSGEGCDRLPLVSPPRAQPSLPPPHGGSSTYAMVIHGTR